MITVLTISRDRPSIFHRHLQTVISQTITEPWEIIIIDDSSEGENGQMDVLKQLSGAIKTAAKVLVKFSIYRSKPRPYIGGEGTIINFGIKQALGDAVFVLCGDDLFPEEHFQKVRDAYRLNELATEIPRITYWPLNHLRPGAASQVYFGDGRTYLGDSSLLDSIYSSPECFIRREEIYPSWKPGMNIFWENFVDDRALYPKEFLTKIKGFPEWRASWWRDAFMRVMASNNKQEILQCWSTMSFHQWHLPFLKIHEQEGKDYLDNHLQDTVSNLGDSWGEAEMETINLW